MAMTPRERWLALLNDEKPDRIPTDYWATAEVTRRLLEDLNCSDCEELYEKLHIDGVHRLVVKSTAQQQLDDSQSDIWGICYRAVKHETGTYSEVVENPLANVTTPEQVDDYKWPDPDKHDWCEFARQVQDLNQKRLVSCGDYEPFLLYCKLRGMEQSMIDLMTNPDIADAILGHIFDFYYKLNERMFDIAKGFVDLTVVAEDLGSQHGLLMGMDQIRRFILPNQKKMADLGRSHGIHIFYHTDGAVHDVIPVLIEVTGIEILNPIQWRCPGMEREGLVRDFADKVIFHGAVDNQQTLAFGSTEDVRQEVLDNIRIFSSARWICAPCHNIQPISPTENILALYETIYENGKF